MLDTAGNLGLVYFGESGSGGNTARSNYLQSGESDFFLWLVLGNGVSAKMGAKVTD